MQPSQLAPEQRKVAEDSYRQAISLVRSLSVLLGYPCPIVSREERRRETSKTLTEAVQCK